MKITESISDVRERVGKARAIGQSVVLVPTMGYLHEGHLSLVEAARAEDGAGEKSFVIMSVFVNPLQFGPQEDLAKYPRDLDRDIRLAEGAGVDLLFVPSDREVYPEGASLTTVQVAGVSEGLCGASRPGHFTGVATVVAKLLQICQPDRAYFGQKDYQQLMVIRQMVKDLCMPVGIVSVPIYRESDGLAMSSRNVYLSPEQRKQAPVLYTALGKGAGEIRAGETDYAKVCALVREHVAGSAARLEYVEIRNAEDFQRLDRLQPPDKRQQTDKLQQPDKLLRPDKLRGHVIILLAARLGETRLIDNILVGEREQGQ